MKAKNSVLAIVRDSIQKHPRMSLLLLLIILASTVFALLPPLALETIINTLAAGEPLLFSAAVGYFLLVALVGILDSARESLITAFGQTVTHQLRSAMSEKLNRLPASYFIERDAGATASCFVNDVDTVEKLFSSGVISMAADLFRLISILLIIFGKSVGLGLLLLLVTPLLFALTRKFQKSMKAAQLDHRIAVSRTNQQIPETLKNMRTIRVLRQERYMLHRYGDTIEQGYRAQERSNFYDAIYSPIILSVSALLVGILMAASAQSGYVQSFFGMSAGTAAAMIAYIGSFFAPLESIGMEIQNVQSAAAGIQRIRDFLQEEERETTETAVQPSEPDQAPLKTEKKEKPDPLTGPAVQVSDLCFRYHKEDRELFHQLSFSVSKGETVILAGRTGAGKSTLVKLIAGLYRPEQGKIRLFGQAPEAIPENEKRQLFGYVEQQFHPIPGTVGDQVSLHDPQISEDEIRQALALVGLEAVVKQLPQGIHTLCTEALFSQGQFQLLSIARAVVSNPRILLLDEITANLDVQTEKLVLAALRSASQNRTVISVSHRLYSVEENEKTRILQI